MVFPAVWSCTLCQRNLVIFVIGRQNMANQDLCYQTVIFISEISWKDMNTINPGKTILSKTSYHSRYICSIHHLSVNCSINCILNVTYLMSVSMTAEMTSSQNIRSDSQTTAVWIMFTCFQAVVVFLISLARQRTSGILSEKFHVWLTFFIEVLKHSNFISFQQPCIRNQLQKLH